MKASDCILNSGGCFHTHAHTRTRTHMHAHTRTHTHAHTHTHTHTHTQTQTNKQTQANTHPLRVCVCRLLSVRTCPIVRSSAHISSAVHCRCCRGCREVRHRHGRIAHPRACGKHHRLAQRMCWAHNGRPGRQGVCVCVFHCLCDRQTHKHRHRAQGIGDRC